MIKNFLLFLTRIQKLLFLLGSKKKNWRIFFKFWLYIFFKSGCWFLGENILDIPRWFAIIHLPQLLRDNHDDDYLWNSSSVNGLGTYLPRITMSYCISFNKKHTIKKKIIMHKLKIQTKIINTEFNNSTSN